MKTVVKAVPKKRTIRLKNPDNPSPSGDPWFDDPQNLAVVDEGIRQMKAGEVVSFKDDPELQAISAKYR
ncbi:MAG: hypothetical protein LBT46_10895 [Planctomycetaceae bacterium]|jgi:hypothetical protein|nr:hypothetical protein [Planctomycetaceae bacterium]